MIFKSSKKPAINVLRNKPKSILYITKTSNIYYNNKEKEGPFEILKQNNKQTKISIRCQTSG